MTTSISQTWWYAGLIIPEFLHRDPSPICDLPTGESEVTVVDSSENQCPCFLENSVSRQTETQNYNFKVQTNSVNPSYKAVFVFGFVRISHFHLGTGTGSELCRCDVKSLPKDYVAQGGNEDLFIFVFSFIFGINGNQNKIPLKIFF